MLSIFLCVYRPSVCLWRNVWLGLLPIFLFVLIEQFAFLILSCMTVISFAVILSLSEGCLLISFIVSFAVQKLLSLIRSHLFVFIAITLGMDITLGMTSLNQRRSCCDLCQRVCCLYFPLRDS